MEHSSLLGFNSGILQRSGTQVTECKYIINIEFKTLLHWYLSLLMYAYVTIKDCDEKYFKSENLTPSQATVCNE
jgi:hypothetical protein